MNCKILLLNHVSEIFGAENSLLTVLGAFNSRRFHQSSPSSRVRFILACPGGGPLALKAREIGVETRSFPLERFSKTLDPLKLSRYALRFFLTAADIARMAKREKISLVHANSTIACAYGVFIAKLCHAPLIWHVRDLAPLGILGRLLLVASTKVIAISEAVRRDLLTYGRERACISERGDKYASKVKTIYNGISAVSFAENISQSVRAGFRLDKDGPVIAMVGQLVPWKGHDVFIRSLSQVIHEIPTAKGLIVGGDLFNDHPAYLDSLKKLCVELNVENKIIFTGYRSDVASLIALAEVIVIPSRNEPFGRVALEAMALSKPVVGTRAGGLPEIVVDGVTGLLVPQDDYNAMAQAIIKLLKDKALARSMGEAGYERVCEHFDIRQTAAEIQKLYDELCE